MIKFRRSFQTNSRLKTLPIHQISLHNSYRHLSPIIQSNLENRRQSCHCTECGDNNSFVLRQNIQYPESYIKAHNVRRKRRKARKPDQPRQKSAQLKRHSKEIYHSKTQQTQYIQQTQQTQQSLLQRKQRKAKTFLQPRFMILFEIKNKKLQSKDDQEIKYEFFYANELRLAEQAEQYSSDNTSEISQDTSPKQPNLNVIIQKKILIRKIQPIHNRRTTECIVQANNFQLNKTLANYISKFPTCPSSPIKQHKFTIPMPSITSISHRKLPTESTYQIQKSRRSLQNYRKYQDGKSLLKKTVVF